MCTQICKNKLQNIHTVHGVKRNFYTFIYYVVSSKHDYCKYEIRYVRRVGFWAKIGVVFNMNKGFSVFKELVRLENWSSGKSTDIVYGLL